MRRAFTLVEIMAVILLATILSTAVMVSLAGPKRQATLQDVIQRLAATDHRLRQQALESGKPVTIRYDQSAGKLLRLEDDGGQTTVFDFPDAAALAEVRCAAANDDGSMTCSSLGIMPTYAVALQPKNSPPQWIVFAGLSGDDVKAKDEKEVDAIFANLAPPQPPEAAPGDDAH
jgi:prepilin-type N-terminal cleavage/methylation domain-containing protein